MIITKYKAAQQLGLSKQAVSKWKDEEFFVEHEGKIQVDTDHPAWIAKLQSPGHKFKNRKLSRAATKRHEMNKAVEIDEPEEMEDPPHKPMPDIPAPQNPETADLSRLAKVAEYQDVIFTAKIREEKAKQEEIKTLEIKKDLANVDLLIHFFSFTENLIQRWYRRPHEISPQLSSLYLAGEDKKAVQLLLRELEGIVKDTQKDLINEIEKEGFKIKDEYFRS